MKTRRAVFYKNVVDAGPGNLVEVLRRRRIELVVVDLERKKVPVITDFDLAFFGGGPQSANDRTIPILGQLEQIKLGLLQQLPMLGICLGAQMLVKAAGGSVGRAPVAERGLYDAAGKPFTVDLTPRGKKDPLFRGLGADSFKVFQMHDLTFNLASVPQRYRAVLLGTGAHCPNQVVKIGSGYGFQSHIEFTVDSVRRLSSKVSVFKALGQNLVVRFEEFYPEYFRNTSLFVNNFLDIAGM